MSRLTRRRFLQSTSVAAGTSLILAGTRASAQVRGANDRLRIAVVGVHGRGRSHIDGWLGQDNVELAYLVDPDQQVLSETLKSVAGKTAGRMTTQGVSDVRRVLEDKTVDAVSIATPNHWHSLITIWAAQAGKHVYVEKPMSHDVAEGRVAVEAQKKYGVVVQHGTQRRSDAKIAGLHEAIQAGKFGPLKISYGYACKPRNGIGYKPGSAPPQNLDWNLWRGPAQVDNYHDNLVHYNWHWFWKTGNGDLNNQGTHQLDVARWALDTDQTHPVRAMAIGGRFQWDDQGETPNTMMGLAEYPNGQQVFFNVRNVNYDGYQRQVENEYYFEDGGKISGGKYFAAGSNKGESISVPDGKVTPGGNWASFIAACRAGDPGMANGNASDAHYGCVLGHLMNNSYRLGTKVPFNARAGRFGDNADAHEHFMRLHEVMRDGVGIPEDGAQYVVGPWLSFDPQTERHVGEHADRADALLKDPNRAGFEVPDAARVSRRMLEIVLGTHNANKLAELKQLLPGGAVRLCSLAELPTAIVVDETGSTFQQNAALKATAQALHLGRWVLAEDSGISVDALEGRPGVFSARYAGDQADDAANNRRLLDELRGVPDDRRGAHYTCQLCLSDPTGTVRLEATGYCHGRIAHQEAGEHGFGYDPLFLIPEYHRTFGQLGPAVKGALSHRARALRTFIPGLLRLVQAR